MNIALLKSDFLSLIKTAKTEREINNLRLSYLGRKGIINNLFSKISILPIAEKKAAAKEVNFFKQLVVSALEKNAGIGETGSVLKDVTMPGIKNKSGSLHVVTYAIEEISRIFERLGFIRQSYPEVDWEYFSFEALNMPATHPARDDIESFFLESIPHNNYGRMVLTPHTSNGQIREMQRLKQPPIKMINISRTYRPNWDISHTPMFHQFEGLCIDSGIRLTDLKGTIEHFVREFFGADREIRLRPFHFQFTEPSFEVDISCGVCLGTGKVETKPCRLCKSGWLELGGSGMVHPAVLEGQKINSDKFSGWAFGFGIERVYMMKSALKLDDIRLLYSGDIRFLEQF